MRAPLCYLILKLQTENINHHHWVIWNVTFDTMIATAVQYMNLKRWKAHKPKKIQVNCWDCTCDAWLILQSRHHTLLCCATSAIQNQLTWLNFSADRQECSLYDETRQHNKSLPPAPSLKVLTTLLKSQGYWEATTNTINKRTHSSVHRCIVDPQLELFDALPSRSSILGLRENRMNQTCTAMTALSITLMQICTDNGSRLFVLLDSVSI